MTSYPIIFSAPMVLALLDDRMKQIRQIIRPQPSAVDEYGTWYGQWPQSLRDTPCPYGRRDDDLLVFEATLNVEDDGWIGPLFLESEEGRAALGWGVGEFDDPAHIPSQDLKIRPASHMPIKYSRFTLRISGVRIERLQDISEEDALVSVVYLPVIEGGSPGYKFARGEQEHDTAVEAYRDFWEQTHGTGSWDENPWVWALEFDARRNG